MNDFTIEELARIYADNQFTKEELELMRDDLERIQPICCEFHKNMLKKIIRMIDNHCEHKTEG